jgi:hypothetical protein
MNKLNLYIIVLGFFFTILYFFEKIHNSIETKKNAKNEIDQNFFEEKYENEKLNISTPSIENLEKPNSNLEKPNSFNLQEIKKEETEKEIYCNEKKFSNMREYEEDLVLLYKIQPNDLPEIVDLKNKLNQEMNFNFEKIYAIDLLNHIKVNLSMEKNIVLPKELEENIKDMFFKFSPTRGPKSPGSLLGLILQGAKLSYYFRDNTIFFFEPEIEKMD